jgi:hypothetical protein
MSSQTKDNEQTSNVFCEGCGHGFTVEKNDVNWIKETFDTDLGYHTFKATLFCPHCGKPISMWKRD